MAEVISRGYSTLAGLGLESTVGTAVAVTQRIALISESLSAPPDEIADASLAGTPTPRPADNGAERPQGTLLANLEYAAGNLVLRHFLGGYTAATTPFYSFLDTLEDLSVTLAIDKQVPENNVWQYAGVKFSQLVISGSPTDGVRWEATILGTDEDYVTSPNSPAVLSALSEAGERILYHHLTLEIDADLTSAPTTEYNPQDFTLTINRNMADALVNSLTPLEALENDYRETTLELTFPRYSTVTQQFLTWRNAGTLFQMAMTFTDGSSTLKFEFPICKVMDSVANIGGPGLPSQTVTIACYNNEAGDNTHLSSVTEELYVTE